MRRPPRIVFLTLVLIALALWIAVDDRSRTGSPDGPLPVVPARGATAASTSERPTQLALPMHRTLVPMDTDPFSVQAPRTAATGARSKTAAPPLPFRFVGRVYLDTGTMVFLKDRGKLVSVKKGDSLDGGYVVESVGSTRIIFLHRPTGTRQILPISPPIEDARAAPPRGETSSSAALDPASTGSAN
ncbi:MAG: hypothetical protein M0015_07020 [Betaproteobacteria bacterium]|nr:hypothetical protein [Betaproteobacteria bacterium]